MKCPRRVFEMSHRKDGPKNGTACCLNFFFFFFKINQTPVISFIPSKGSQRSLFGKMLITSVSGSSPPPLPALAWLLGGLPALPLDTSQCEQIRQKKSSDFRGTVFQLQSSGQHAPGGPRLRCCLLQGNHKEDATQWPSSLPVTSVFLLESLSFFYLSSKCNPRRVGWREGNGVEEVSGEACFHSLQTLPSKSGRTAHLGHPGNTSAAAPHVH